MPVKAPKNDYTKSDPITRKYSNGDGIYKRVLKFQFFSKWRTWISSLPSLLQCFARKIFESRFFSLLLLQLILTEKENPFWPLKSKLHFRFRLLREKTKCENFVRLKGRMTDWRFRFKKGFRINIKGYQYIGYHNWPYFEDT